MTTRALATLDEHGIKAVNAEEMAQEVRALLPGSMKATDNEIRLFVRFCMSLGANPFVKEAYLIKYQDGQPASIVLGLRWKLKQAAKNPAYQGYKAGLIVQADGKPLEYREGAFSLPGEEKVVGAWCEVHRQGWTVTPKHAVSMSEYFAGGRANKNLWDSKPNTMIMKVAISQAIERAFPEEAGATERSIASANIRVVDEGQAGVDLEDARSSLSDAAAPVTQRSEPTPPAEGIAPQVTLLAPKRGIQDASNEFWPKVRVQNPDLDSMGVLKILNVKMFTEWKGSVDEALAQVKAKATK
jgi:phage recombination protein Bet